MAAKKNEILFSQFGINYNNEDEIFKKGSIVFRDVHLSALPTEELFTDMIQYKIESAGSGDIAAMSAGSAGDGVEISRTQKEKERKRRMKAEIITQHTDFIKDEFWQQRPWLLSDTGS